VVIGVVILVAGTSPRVDDSRTNPAALRLHERPDDREAEPRRAGPAVPRGVGLAEAVEDQRQVVGRDPRPGVASRHLAAGCVLRGASVEASGPVEAARLSWYR
jgi:hypothetical protein